MQALGIEMMDRANVKFIDGYLTAISHLCDGCNFVPIYGANEIVIVGGNMQQSLDNHFNSSSAVSDLSESTVESKEAISYMVKKWVGARLFEGELKNKKVSTRFQLHKLESYLLEFIEDIVSSKHKLFRFHIEHDDFGNETEALGFYGNEKFLYIYFGWWD